MGDFNRVQEDGDVECLEEKVEEVLPDAWPDHPTSTEDVQPDSCDIEEFKEKQGRRGSIEPTRKKDNEATEIGDTRSTPDDISLVDVANVGKPDEDYRASDVDKADLEKSEGEEVLDGETQTVPSQNENVSLETIDTGEWNSERQRPTRTTRRPTCFRNSEFETQFRPEERSAIGLVGETKPRKMSTISATSTSVQERCTTVLVGEKRNRKSSGESAYWQKID